MFQLACKAVYIFCANFSILVPFSTTPLQMTIKITKTFLSLVTLASMLTFVMLSLRAPTNQKLTYLGGSDQVSLM